MSFAALYEYCQSLAVPIGQNAVREKVCELTGRTGLIRVMCSNQLADEVMWGCIVWPGTVKHPYAQFCNGEPLIVVARGLDERERRFVVVKELMHLFDEALERVSTPQEFEELLTHMSAPAPDGRSAAMQSEANCMWMALTVMCPEAMRQDLQRKREAGEIGDVDIAERLKIPEVYVPLLFVPNFKQIVTYLTNC
ncbi:MAG: hypothetical protein WBG81_07520 [Rhodanobacter sp.]|jgi:hypothetical protein|uniref:hypothetical protein n=1 Tax=Rhodanobacter sp. KK11 TaxID=3083255 RepID=UPI00296661C9|nr:hypothetical protein [Rhodanobacter sp. KK11]MDW2979951.1 hypothetical protein [Rhodanobacter sp. KK11]